MCSFRDVAITQFYKLETFGKIKNAQNTEAVIQELLAENAFCHEIASEGHSRSFILQTFASLQEVAYRHIILLAVSLKFSKT